MINFFLSPIGAPFLGMAIVFAVLNIPYVKRIAGEFIDNIIENRQWNTLGFYN